MHATREPAAAANALDERLAARERQLAAIVTQLAAAVIQHQPRFAEEECFRAADESGDDGFASCDAAGVNRTMPSPRR